MASNVPECKPSSLPMVVSKKHSALDDELIDASRVRELGGSQDELDGVYESARKNSLAKRFPTIAVPRIVACSM